MMKNALLVLMLLAMPVSAEVLVIDKVQQDQAVAHPASGMSMDQVRAQYGDPQSIIDPVGDPPITRWVYPAFTVYFEYDRVIHAVINRPESTP